MNRDVVISQKICKLKCITGINKTDSKFTTGINDALGKYWEQY
jgi:hypothetical protein